MKNDVLFDIGFDMDKLEGKEKLFYEDQKNKREGQLDKHVDVEYEQQQELKQQVEVGRLQRLKLEEDYIISPFEDAQEPDTMNSPVLSVSDENSTLNLSPSVNRSGYVRCTAVRTDAGVQTENPSPDQPSLRIGMKICTEAIKSTCAMVSSTCGVSNETARKIVQIVARELYNHNFYLAPEEQFYGERTELEETATVESDFKTKDYTYVIASAGTIGDHKQMLASEAESEAAAMLLKKDSNTKVTIHFDTTSHSNIDREWPSIILRFSNNVNIEYRLRPIFFAYEDCDQITKFFCETFE